MNDKRKNPRHKLRDYPIAYDRILGMMIGRVLDLSTNGLRMIIDSPIEKLTQIKCRLQLPEEIDGVNQVLIDIRCVWCKKNTVHGAFEAGFSFLNPSEGTLRLFHKFLESAEMAHRAAE
jgi:hypothetical protein